MKNAAIGSGWVESLSLNGEPAKGVLFETDGPVGDRHSGFVRSLSGHDGAYLSTSARKKGDLVFNWRPWTAISIPEIKEIEGELGVSIPQGCLLENIVIGGIPNFSKLLPTSRLVFPEKADGTQLILAVWEENGPCKGVGQRLQDVYPENKHLCKRFIASAQNRRGVMGLVLSRGSVWVGDYLTVYPPKE